MKIGITCYPTIGGSGIIATELGKKLAANGHEIHFITSSIPFRLDTDLKSIFYHEVEITNYPVFQYPPYDLALAAKMAEVIDREGLDILHVHYAMPHAISAILAKDIANHNVKIVTTLHGTDITVLGFDKSFRRMIAYGIEKSDAVTAVSQNLVEQTKEKLQVDKDIKVIHNFVDEKEYTRKELPELKSYYNIQDDESVIIHISNFRKVKRVQDVVKTFAKVNAEIKSKLILVGDGPELQNIIDTVKKFNIEEKVLFLGKQKNVNELLSISDVKLLMSEQESFGLVLLEAMACQVAPVGTNIGGIPEVIKDGETGYIVPKSDTDYAAYKIVNLLSKPDLLKKIQKNAYKSVQESFSSDTIVNQYLALYREVKNGVS